MTQQYFWYFLKAPLSLENNAFVLLNLKPKMFLLSKDLEEAYETHYCTISNYNMDNMVHNMVHNNNTMMENSKAVTQGPSSYDGSQKNISDLHEAYGLLKNPKKRAQHLLYLRGHWPPKMTMREDFVDFLFELKQQSNESHLNNDLLEKYSEILDNELENKNIQKIHETYWVIAALCPEIP